jgi:hypothetical protein
MQVKKFLEVSERYLTHDPLVVVADKTKNVFWYIQDRLKQDRKVKITKQKEKNNG